MFPMKFPKTVASLVPLRRQAGPAEQRGTTASGVRAAHRGSQSGGARLARAVLSLATLGCLALGACGSEPAAPTQPVGWDAELAPPEAPDLNADPRIVEVTLDARVTNLSLTPGASTPCFTYGDRIPGPVIRARVGDRLIVHFANHLPEPTTIHWHGVRVPNDMDGVPGVSQEQVPPGGTFDYDFILPDAGTYWYHPHVDSALQVGNGLYGALIVTDPGDPTEIDPALGKELVLVLSDMGIDPDGSLFPADTGGELGTLFGREGNVILANGRVNPTLQARPGLRQRWRIINAAKSRYFQLAWEGNQFLRIGSDGGRLEEPERMDRVVLTPAQRADVVVAPAGGPGATSVVRWVPYDRGFGSTFNRPEEPIFTVQMTGDVPVEPPPLPPLHRDILPIDTAGATLVDLSLNSGKNPDGSLLLNINDRTPADWDAHPLEANFHERQVWTVTNTIAFAHPFHIHGFFFQVLDEQGQPVHPMEWRDTADVPVDGKLRLVIRYDDRPGMWMFHCHILDHADAGMMGTLMLGANGAHTH
jgi:FtsP/CotA-like multicopper oxidase with cupredoxin domain